MIYLLLITIVLLIYIAFFTPEIREQRNIRRVQKIFNRPHPSPKEFDINDPRNETHPDEVVSYRGGISHRKLAVMLYKMEQESLEGDVDKTNNA